MTLDHLHLATAEGNPACGLKDDCARLTANYLIVTCPSCRKSRHFKTTKKHRLRAVGRARNSGVRKVRADASTYIRRALRIIDRLPVLA